MELEDYKLKSISTEKLIQMFSEEHLKYDRVYYLRVFIDYFDKTERNWNAYIKYLFDGLNNRLERKYMSETLYTQHCLIRSAFSYAEAAGYIKPEENIFFRRQLPPQIKNRFKAKRKEEYKPVKVEHDIFESFLFDYLRNRSKNSGLFNIARLAYYTGMRLNEVCSLEWREIKTNYIFKERTKERHPRNIMLLGDSPNVVRELIKNKTGKSKFVFTSSKDENECISSATIGELIRRHWLKYGEIEPKANFAFSFKSFRAACAQNVQFSGITHEAIKKQLGHHDPIVTDFSYNGSFCSRAISENLLNPKNEVITLVSGILRREVSEDDVLALDVVRFSQRVKEIISECTQDTTDNSVFSLSIPISKGGRPKKHKAEKEAKIIQFHKIG